MISGREGGNYELGMMNDELLKQFICVCVERCVIRNCPDFSLSLREGRGEAANTPPGNVIASNQNFK